MHHTPCCLTPLEPRVLLSGSVPTNGITAAWGSQGGGPNNPLTLAQDKADALEAIGLGFARVGLKENYFYTGSGPTQNRQPNPSALDGRIELVLDKGVKPMVLFDYYDKDPNDITDYDWYQIGYQFAQRYQPDSAYLQSQGIFGHGVEHWAAFNEPDVTSQWDYTDNQAGFDPTDYAQALEDFADGIHAADPDARVVNGAFAGFNYSGKWDGSGNGGDNSGYLNAIAPLFNDGTLDGLHLHNYYNGDVPDKWAQLSFDRHKVENGITADVNYYIDEFNVGNDSQASDRDFYTQLWTHSMIVGNGGNDSPVKTVLMNAFDATSLNTPSWKWGMTTSYGPWTGTTRGELLQDTAALVQGMHVVAARPHGLGYAILSGEGQTAWVWHNRAPLSQFHGDAIKISDIPTDATRIDIYGYEGLVTSYATGGLAELSLFDLPTDQTLLFIADSENAAGTAGLSDVVNTPGRVTVTVGDVDAALSVDPGDAATAVTDPAWYATADAKWSQPIVGFDTAGKDQVRAWTMDFAPGNIVAAELYLIGRSETSNPGFAEDDFIFFDGITSADRIRQSDLGFELYTQLPQTNVIDLAAEGKLGLLADGQLNLAITDDTNIDYARLVLTYAETDPTIGEAGRVTFDQPSESLWRRVELNNAYVDPVVVMGPPSFAGSEPLTVRVRNVQARSFEFQFDEWDYLNGTHGSETVGYLVMERGRHVLQDGTVIEAGQSTVGDNFSTTSFTTAFASKPIVLSQIATTNDSATAITRQRSVTASSFQVKLEEQESDDQTHADEMVHWIAMDLGSGISNGRLFEAGTTGNSVTHQWSSVSFTNTYTNSPVFLATNQTYDGSDTAAVRYRNLNSQSSEVVIQEETSQDTEISHTTEEVGYAVFTPGDLRITTANTTADIDFSTKTFTAYSGVQDGQNNQATSVDVDHGGAVVHLQGNAWKKIDFSYSVTTDTWITFEVRSTNPGEIMGIALDNDDNHSNTNRVFAIGGSQSVPNDMINYPEKYTANTGWVTYQINVGAYFTGVTNHLALIADDDQNGMADVWFRNIRVFDV